MKLVYFYAVSLLFIATWRVFADDELADPFRDGLPEVEYELVDGVQRLSATYFFYQPEWLKSWKRLVLSQDEPDHIFFVLIVVNEEGLESFIMSKDPNGDPDPYRMLYVNSANEVATSKRFGLNLPSFVEIIAAASKLVEGAESDAQQFNIALGENEVWYIFCGSLLDGGEPFAGLGSMEAAEGYNPPQGGILRTIRSDLMKLMEEK